MKEVYWKELLEIFESDEELKVNHETLYNNISLIVKANDTHKELEELNELKKKKKDNLKNERKRYRKINGRRRKYERRTSKRNCIND